MFCCFVVRNSQEGGANHSDPKHSHPPACWGRGFLEETELSLANHTQTGAENHDANDISAAPLPGEQRGACCLPPWPRPGREGGRGGLPRSLPCSPLLGRWAGTCVDHLTPPPSPSRWRVEAALQRSKDGQRVRPHPPRGRQEREWLRSREEKQWSDGARGQCSEEEVWRYCLLSPCICLR